MFKSMLKMLAIAMIAAAITAGGLAWWSAQPRPITERPVDRIITYTVHSGDTIWNVASNFAPDDGDLRLYIWEIERLNGRKLSRINPGDKIVIPIYREEMRK